ncbi:threonine aldolase family protein [Streptomyces sp. NBC_01431]|uniref:threonine aldolase family protein n=1 Tax=Streptomyces sp. NBC_01431 TaxID=2903863 RepID=UPI002E2F4197|nr:beta-eliminating lyase-related protein [Streptomyces sp. NBC_01431]
MADPELHPLPESTSDAPGGTADKTPEQARQHRLAVFRGAKRTLADQTVDHTLAERLTALLADGAEVYDLDEFPDVYGNGAVAELERRTAEALGFPAAAFFPTGTMAQQVALRCWASRTGDPTVALHPMAHPEVHERDAFSQVSGLRTVHPTEEPRLPNADEVRGFEEPFATLMLELPLRDAGYVLPTWDELVAVVDAARERDAVVHFDGARLWETTVHFGRSLPEIAGLADSVYVSFYKTLGGLSGAVLVGSESLIEQARTWRHRYGGQLFQQFPAALAGLLGLRKVLPELPSYVAHAKVVAEAMKEGFTAAGVPWFRVHPEPPHTHEFQVWLPYDAEVLSAAALAQAEESGVCLFRRWFANPSGPAGLAFTEVTVNAPGLAWTAEDVRAAVADFVRRLP